MDAWSEYLAGALNSLRRWEDPARERVLPVRVDALGRLIPLDFDLEAIAPESSHDLLDSGLLDLNLAECGAKLSSMTCDSH